MKKVVKYILILALLVLVVLQFIRPDKNNGGYDSIAAFEAETVPTQQVKEILKTNCYDCHSNKTHYSLYAEIAPFSYWLDDHIRHGKGEFNVSRWDEYSIKRKDHKLEEVIEMVENKEMPLDSYTWVHGELSESDANALVAWATLARLQYSFQLKVSSK